MHLRLATAATALVVLGLVAHPTIGDARPSQPSDALAVGTTSPGSVPADPVAHIFVRLGAASVRLRDGQLANIATGLSGAASGATSAKEASAEGLVDRLNTAVDSLGTTLRPYFGTTETLFDEQQILAERVWKEPVNNKNSYFLLDVPASEGTSTVNRLAAIPGVVESGIVQSPPPLPTSPDLRSTQWYRQSAAAESGIDADAASLVPGGQGENVTIADVEYSWNTSHEDLDKAGEAGALVKIGIPRDPWNSTDHGTAVLGELVGDADALGVTGLVPKATVHLVNADSNFGYNPEAAVSAAQAVLHAGDVILIEQQAYGPYGCGASQYGCVPVEWGSAMYTAIKSATAAGIVVVEAAGNGQQDLDITSVYGSPFPAGRSDSGAIIVGAGSECSQPYRTRLSFSDYGSRVNLQGWGECVTTTGYGYRYNGGPNALYTASFSGTSSASPIVAAAAAVVSSVAKQQGVAMTPLQIRDLLVRTGTPGATGAKIGPLPDLAAALSAFVPVAIITAPTTAVGGTTVALSAASSSDPQGYPLQYSWDLNGDGVFGDSTVVAPRLALGRTATSLTISLRVTDAGGAVANRSTTLLITAPPRAEVPSTPVVTLSPRIPAPTVLAPPSTIRIGAPPAS